MSALRTLVKHDIRSQHRFGIYHAYAVVVAFYIAVILGLGDALPDWVIGLVIFSDPAAVGFFFLGALMLLEKSEGTRAALAVTPLRAVTYFWSKCITLSSMAVIAALLVSFVHGGVNFALLMPIVLLTSIQYLGIGVPIAGRFKTVTAYMIGAAFYLTPVILPAYFALLDPMPVWALLIPAAAQLKLILIATGHGTASTLQIATMFLVATAAALFCVLWAIRNLQREFGE